jgi:2-polyprenyl-3-methyl-5-hydroxy-6-metoxy-1,4-benzoquinol methylase
MEKLNNEIESFKSIWKGGYRTGYNSKRNQKGIEEYLKKNMVGKTLLEIGCGGGQWSKFIHDLNIYDKMYCIDVLSETHNNFWNYVGHEKTNKISYCQVNDFNLDCIPDDSLDYVFSYDVFCHISLTGQDTYLKNLYKKCKTDCILLIMYADPNKYFKNEPENIYIQKNYQLSKGKVFTNDDELIKILIEDCDSNPVTGRWYWIGIENFLNLCNKYKYNILTVDLDIDKTNPLTL